MGDVTVVRTERLLLTATGPRDAEALAPIMADPDGWWYEPESRHTSPERTRAWLERAAQRWDEGLSYWTIRLAETDEVIGVGGVQRHSGGGWNLSYRIGTAHQGNGYATEVTRAAIEAAHQVDPDAPVIAWVAAHNTPSRKVAERAGLTDQGERLDTNDNTMRHAYADRPLPAPTRAD